MVPVGFYAAADNIVRGDKFKGHEYSDKTYNLDTMNSGGSVAFISGREAVRQAVVKILNTERFRYPIYSTDYGIESEDLLGKDCDYACVELERRISEALTADTRITNVSAFDFITCKSVIHASFNVHTVFGEFETEGIFNV